MKGIEPKEFNKVRFSAKESIKHFATKAMIAWILNERGIRFMTEAPVEVHNSVSYIDVFDVDNGIAYEPQTEWHGGIKRLKDELYDSELVKDVIIVRLKKLSNRIPKMKEQLEKIVV